MRLTHVLELFSFHLTIHSRRINYDCDTWGGADFKFATRIGTIPERKCPMNGKYMSLFLPLSANGPERNDLYQVEITINLILAYFASQFIELHNN